MPLKNVRQLGSATIWSIVGMGIALVVIQQIYTRINNRKNFDEVGVRKSRFHFVADYYRSQMVSPQAAYNTRKANPLFDQQASLLPSESSFDFQKHPLEVRNAANTVIIAESGAYMDKRMNPVAANDPARLYFIQAFWQRVGPVPAKIEEQYPSPMQPDKLLSEIRVQKILRVSLADTKQGKSDFVESKMGADICLVARGKMNKGIVDYKGTNVQGVRGIATCPQGYFLMSSYIVDSAATEDSYRVKWETPGVENSLICTIWTDAIRGPGLTSPYASGMVFNTVDGGVDTNRSVLPQHWHGKLPYPDQPLDRCYALCCDKNLGM